MQLKTDGFSGDPSLGLSDDQLATAIDLLCRGVTQARTDVTAGMYEVPITILVRKSMRRIKRQLSLTSIQIGGEEELLDPDDHTPTVVGRIDIVFQFLHQFGREDAYLGVECKRIASGDTQLSARYVSEGVDRFATGKYGEGHEWGIMLGYVLKMPVESLVSDIDSRMSKHYGDHACLGDFHAHQEALTIRQGILRQGSSDHDICLVHIFVELTIAAADT